MPKLDLDQFDGHTPVPECPDCHDESADGECSRCEAMAKHGNDPEPWRSLWGDLATWNGHGGVRGSIVLATAQNTVAPIVLALLAELRAAREVVEAATAALHRADLLGRDDCGLRTALAAYDEATR